MFPIYALNGKSKAYLKGKMLHRVWIIVGIKASGKARPEKKSAKVPNIDSSPLAELVQNINEQISIEYATLIKNPRPNATKNKISNSKELGAPNAYVVGNKLEINKTGQNLSDAAESLFAQIRENHIQ